MPTAKERSLKTRPPFLTINNIRSYAAQLDRNRALAMLRYAAKYVTAVNNSKERQSNAWQAGCFLWMLGVSNLSSINSCRGACKAIGFRLRQSRALQQSNKPVRNNWVHNGCLSPIPPCLTQQNAQFTTVHHVGCSCASIFITS